MQEGRTKLFLENILIYGLGTAMNSIIPFIMLPIITRLLPSSKFYGINDTVNIFVSFGSAIAIMGMYDAMYRFYFDDENAIYRKEICSSTLFTLIVTGFFMFITVMFFRRPLAELLFSDLSLTPLIIIGGLNIWVISINTIVAAPTRMRNERWRYIIIQTLIPIISYSLSIPLILKGEYIYALPLAALSSNIIVCIIFSVFNRYDFNLMFFNLDKLKQMLYFGVPLMPVFIFFWILSSVGRIIINNTWGLEYTGIYAAAGKIAAVSQLIYAAFAGGWQYFAFSTMQDNDYIELISRIFDYLAGISFFATVFIILIIRPVFTILLPPEYFKGIIVVPALFLSPLILMLRQTIGIHFQVKKMSILGTSTIAFGAIIALGLYFLLIPTYGISGAAIASLIGYVATLLLTIRILKKMKLILISSRVCVGALLTVFVLIVFMSGISKLTVSFAAVLEGIFLLMVYCRDVIALIKNVREK